MPTFVLYQSLVTNYPCTDEAEAQDELQRSALIDKRGLRISEFQPSSTASHTLAHHPPSPTSYMMDQSGSSHFQALFEAAFREL